MKVPGANKQDAESGSLAVGITTRIPIRDDQGYELNEDLQKNSPKCLLPLEALHEALDALEELA